MFRIINIKFSVLERNPSQASGTGRKYQRFEEPTAVVEPVCCVRIGRKIRPVTQRQKAEQCPKHMGAKLGEEGQLARENLEKRNWKIEPFECGLWSPTWRHKAVVTAHTVSSQKKNKAARSP